MLVRGEHNLCEEELAQHRHDNQEQYQERAYLGQIRQRYHKGVEDFVELAEAFHHFEDAHNSEHSEDGGPRRLLNLDEHFENKTQQG